MPKIAANLSHLWPELPYLDRFDAAAEAGFDGVEVLFPYDVPAKDTRRALLRSGLPLVLINAPPPNYTGGVRGFAAVPGAEDRFRFDLKRALRYCEALRVPMLNVMTGAGAGPEARAVLVENLRWAARMVPEQMTLTLEPMHDAETPGCFLNDYDLAVAVLREIGAAHVGLQFDSYHAQMIHGDAVAVFEKYKAWVRHVEIGDAPGRGIPGSGEVDFAGLFAALEASSYDGWISAAYTPGPQNADSLAWVATARG